MPHTFMHKAIDLSRAHMRAQAGGPFGAVIVLNNVVIGEGWNQVTSTNDPTAHAEIVAIRDACQRLGAFSLEGAEIYASCEPCPMCLSAIYWARLSRVYYANTRQDAARIGFDDALLYQEIAKDLHTRLIPMTQCAHAEALAVFDEWQRKDDKRPY
jgi:tRNA(Arg) A34 adenosine deaminase TadA